MTGYLNVINSVCKKRKNHRMLLYNFRILPHSNYPSAYQMVKDILKEFKIDQPTRSISDALDALQQFPEESKSQ